MRSVRETIGAMWKKLNPSEPSPLYLITFLSTAACLFIIAYMIGHL